MSIISTSAPAQGQRMQIVLEVRGGINADDYKAFTAALKQLADQYKVGIGARGAVVDSTGSLQK